MSYHYRIKRIGGIEMDEKKHISSGFFILLLLAVTILSSCKEINMHSKNPTFDSFELFKNENLDDVSLTIYYGNPFILTRFPLSVDNLMKSSIAKKMVINGRQLEEHLDLFKQINNEEFIPVKKKSYLDARLYYVLESKKNGKLFDVAMWGGDNNSIFANGFEVKGNDIFYDVVKPFLPEDAVREFDNFVAGIWTE
jgi:hypothetical protein